MKENIKRIINILKNYRISSKTYVNMSYFIVIAIFILKSTEYIVRNKIILAKPLMLILALIVLIIIPIGFLYYAIKTGIEISKRGKSFNCEYQNKCLWLSDLIYIATIIYVHFCI